MVVHLTSRLKGSLRYTDMVTHICCWLGKLNKKPRQETEYFHEVTCSRCQYRIKNAEHIRWTMLSVKVIPLGDNNSDYLARVFDGDKCIASHLSSSEEWALYDIGFTSKKNHDKYFELYPDGWNMRYD